ncbi:MAG: gliding motility lipoprotein GldD [Lentimicrobiaceae bacterium]
MKPVKTILSNAIILISLIFLVVACNDNTIPKPRGFFRIDTPKRAYKVLDSIYPYVFEYPVYSVITSDPNAPDEPNWINIDYKGFKGKLHISYKVVNNNLDVFTEDAHSMVMKHIPKASAIQEVRIDNDKNNVHGIIYDIEGTGAASPYQFFVTDSTKHFMRGALYFSALPNNDSLAPVITFLKEDINHMLETLRWK